MNDKCKYCDYLSKCSRICEYNSYLCKVHRSFPKVVDKSYEQLQQENKILKENAEHNDKVVDKVNWENQLLKKENKQLKDLIDTILNFSFFKEECPLNFGFENNTNEDKSQSIFYEENGVIFQNYDANSKIEELSTFVYQMPEN